MPGLDRDRAQHLGGVAAVVLGSFIVALVLIDPSAMSQDVPKAVGIAAGSVFVLAGVVLSRASRRGGRAGELVTRLLTAVLLTLFAGVAMIFPPGGIFVVFVAVLGWIAVYRSIHERVTGRDPLGGLSQEKQLGVGCLVMVALMLLAALVTWVGCREEAPQERSLPKSSPATSTPPARR